MPSGAVLVLWLIDCQVLSLCFESMVECANLCAPFVCSHGFFASLLHIQLLGEANCGVFQESPRR